MDYNATVKPYGEGKDIHTVIEIPMGSTHKIEFDRRQKLMILDREEPHIFPKPANYGFIPGTLDEDGDELDTLLVTDDPLPTGVLVTATVLGVLIFEDGGEVDYKIICVPTDDRHTGGRIKSLEDLGERWMAQVEHHFIHYKDLKKAGTTKVMGFGDVAKAHQIIEECIERWNKQ